MSFLISSLSLVFCDLNLSNSSVFCPLYDDYQYQITFAPCLTSVVINYFNGLDLISFKTIKNWS
jgi:hypothetical protein